MHGGEAGAIAFLQHPFGVLAHHLGLGWLHQAVFEPGDHLQAAPVGGLGEAADRIEPAVGLAQGRLQRRPTAGVEGGAPAPHIRVEGVETCLSQFVHGPIEPAGVVVEGAGAIGQPHAHPRQGLPWLGPALEAQAQQGGQHPPASARQPAPPASQGQGHA